MESTCYVGSFARRGRSQDLALTVTTATETYRTVSMAFESNDALLMEASLSMPEARRMLNQLTAAIETVDARDQHAHNH